MMVECGNAEQLGQNHARLGKPVIVRLQAGQHQVRGLLLDGARQGPRHPVSVEGLEGGIVQVQRPIRALGQRFLDGLLGARRPQRTHHHLPAMFFLQAQGFFQRIDVRLIDFETEVRFLDPGSRRVQAKRSIAGRDLFEANNDFHCREAVRDQQPAFPAYNPQRAADTLEG